MSIEFRLSSYADAVAVVVVDCVVELVVLVVVLIEVVVCVGRGLEVVWVMNPVVVDVDVNAVVVLDVVF